jgi:hypothetical protein
LVVVIVGNQSLHPTNFKPSGIIYSKKNTAKGKTEKKKEKKSKGHVKNGNDY